MKQFFVLMISLFTSVSGADPTEVLNGDLDLTRLAQGLNAGQYKVLVSVSLKDQAESQIKRKVISTPSPRCQTEISIVVGSVTLQLTDVKTGKARELSQVLLFRATDHSLDQSCPSTDFLNSQYVRYDADVAFSKDLALAYSAPAGFQKLKATFTALPYGLSVHLKAKQMGADHFVYSGLPRQLAPQLNRGSSEALQWEVHAAKYADSVALGQGFAVLK